MKKLPYFFSLIVLLSTVFGSAPARAQVSPQAKGAIIGGLGGAAAGAIINKRNRAVGGVVGGVAGGAIGYGVGKHIDNTKKKKEAARIAAAREATREANARAAARNAAARSNSAEVASRSQAGSVPTSALVAASPMAYSAQEAAVAPGGAAYLPNNSYGNPGAPYPDSEYRRKSW